MKNNAGGKTVNQKNLGRTSGNNLKKTDKQKRIKKAFKGWQTPSMEELRASKRIGEK